MNSNSEPQSKSENTLAGDISANAWPINFDGGERRGVKVLAKTKERQRGPRGRDRDRELDLTTDFLSH